jgi:hypothetical protein
VFPLGLQRALSRKRLLLGKGEGGRGRGERGGGRVLEVEGIGREGMYGEREGGKQEWKEIGKRRRNEICDTHAHASL